MLRFLFFACAVLSFSLLGCSAALATAKNSTPGDSSPRSVCLHINSDRPVRLERAAPGDTAWHFVCTSPCDEPVSDDAVFRITGDDVLASFPFRIRVGSFTKRVSLAVDAPSKTIHDLGIAGTVSGGVVAMGGLLYAFGEYLNGLTEALGSLGCGLSAARPCPPASASPSYTPALTVAAVAGLVALAGIVATVTHPRTSVDGPNVEPTGTPYLPGDPHYAPMLEEQNAPTASRAGPALWIPVLGGTF